VESNPDDDICTSVRHQHRYLTCSRQRAPLFSRDDVTQHSFCYRLHHGVDTCICRYIAYSDYIRVGRGGTNHEEGNIELGSIHVRSCNDIVSTRSQAIAGIADRTALQQNI